MDPRPSNFQDGGDHRNQNRTSQATKCHLCSADIATTWRLGSRIEKAIKYKGWGVIEDHGASNELRNATELPDRPIEKASPDKLHPPPLIDKIQKYAVPERFLLRTSATCIRCNRIWWKPEALEKASKSFAQEPDNRGCRLNIERVGEGDVKISIPLVLVWD